jgi:hypothetical protein
MVAERVPFLPGRNTDTLKDIFWGVFLVSGFGITEVVMDYNKSPLE